jgi:aryl-alcohol dehydrogenase-like predicted oxidoreductase
MDTRPIPSTGEPLPVIGCGTWQAFDVGAERAALDQRKEVLRILLDAGGKVIDSSPMYGSAESVAGDLIAELGLRDKLFIATKVWTRGRAEGIHQMETSFRRFGVDRMDLMQVHNLVDVATHAKTLQEMKQAGKLRYAGVTSSTLSEYGDVERALKSWPWDFLQINYSLGERDSEKRLLPLAREKKVAVIVNRPFQEGVLFQKTKNRALPPWAKEYDINSWAQYFLKWIVSHPAVTCAIPGAKRPAQVEENIAAADLLCKDAYRA